MCRNIRPLFNFEPPATEEEIQKAALQYVKNVSGFNKPSKVNEEVFQATIQRISELTKYLLDNLETNAQPKNRDVETQKAKERFDKRLEGYRNSS